VLSVNQLGYKNMTDHNKYLKALGLKQGVSLIEIKQAYRELAKQWHPDKFLDDINAQRKASEKFREITEAYQFLVAHFREVNGSKVGSIRSIKIEKTNPEFFYNLGVELANVGDESDAIEAFSNAIRCNDKYLKAYQYRAFLLEKLGFCNRAKADFARICELKSGVDLTNNSGSNNETKKDAVKRNESPGKSSEKQHKNCSKKKWSGTFIDFLSPVSAVTVNSTGTLMAVGLENGQSYLWDLVKKECLVTYQKFKTFCRKIIFDPNKNIFYLGGDDGKIYLCQTKNSKIEIFGQPKFQHTSKITSLALDQDGKLLLSGSADKTLKIWNTNRSIEPIMLTGFGSEISDIIITPDNLCMAIASLDKNIRFRNLENGKLTKSIAVDCGINCMDISRDSSFLAIGGFNRTTSIWDINNKAIIATLEEHQSLVSDLHFVSKDNHLITVGNDGLIYDCDWQKQNNQKIGNHYGSIVTSALSSDGKVLVTGGKDKRIGIWINE
jgi:WD40 repeat protein